MSELDAILRLWYTISTLYYYIGDNHMAPEDNDQELFDDAMDAEQEARDSEDSEEE